MYLKHLPAAIEQQDVTKMAKMLELAAASARPRTRIAILVGFPDQEPPAYTFCFGWVSLTSTRALRFTVIARNEEWDGETEDAYELAETIAKLGITEVR